MKNPLETGGILLGHILDNGMWIVMEVLPPGPNSIFERAYFEYDTDFVNYLAQSVVADYEQELNLLGLWHRHPGSLDTFSGTDDVTNRTFALLNPKGAISGLVNIDPNIRLTMYHVTSNPLIYNKIEIEIGDDLIPEVYFAKKHFSETITVSNSQSDEKKNGLINIKKNYERESEKSFEYPKNESIISQIINFLDSNNFFFSIFLMAFTLSLSLSFSYYKLKGNEDIKILYKIMFNIVPNKSELNDKKTIAANTFDEIKVHTIRKELENNDKMNTDTIMINREIAKKREEYVKNEEMKFRNEIRESHYNNLDIDKADIKVKSLLFLWWNVTFLLFLTILFIRYRKLQKNKRNHF
ncbi:MAG: Mov34/MPN/PAD-1 family protein [Marinilabiliaceae bacterium]|nr:Mov34/MPN/PAD-1 family protein [Marinilabiliaceae bacterium]